MLNNQDREAETVLPEVSAETPPEPQPMTKILPWRGRGNVIAAAGVALLDLVGRA